MTSNQPEWVTIRCVEVIQPLGKFYVGVVNGKALVGITWSDLRRLVGEKRDVETYLGIERPYSDKRVSEITEYVRSPDATFPSSIIVAVDGEKTEYDARTGTLRISNEPEAAKILDGQHRLKGIELSEQGRPFDLIVTVFVDIDIENQAMVFATINLEQTKVNRSLAYDLYDYATSRSPFKTAHNIVRFLNGTDGSPFKDKIKVLGVAGDKEETISQATFVTALLRLISRNPQRDRNQIRDKQKPVRADPGDRLLLIFRDMFVDDRDDDITLVLWNYFKAVENRWGEYWTQPKGGFLLNRTTGFNGLMLFLPFAYNSLRSRGEIPTTTDFNEIFSKVRLEGNEISRDNYPPGTAGQIRLRDHLKAQAGLS